MPIDLLAEFELAQAEQAERSFGNPISGFDDRFLSCGPAAAKFGRRLLFRLKRCEERGSRIPAGIVKTHQLLIRRQGCVPRPPATLRQDRDLLRNTHTDFVHLQALELLYFRGQGTQALCCASSNGLSSITSYISAIARAVAPP